MILQKFWIQVPWGAESTERSRMRSPGDHRRLTLVEGPIPEPIAASVGEPICICEKSK